MDFFEISFYNIIMEYKIYVLLLSNGSYYVGCTSNLKKRVQAHYSPSGSGLKTRKFKPIKLVAVGIYPTKKEALIREKELVRFYQKQSLINKGLI